MKSAFRKLALAAVIGTMCLSGCADDHYSNNGGYYQHQGSGFNWAAFGLGALAGHVLSNHYSYVVNHYHTHYHVHR